MEIFGKKSSFLDLIKHFDTEIMGSVGPTWDKLNKKIDLYFNS